MIDMEGMMKGGGMVIDQPDFEILGFLSFPFFVRPTFYVAAIPNEPHPEHI